MGKKRKEKKKKGWRTYLSWFKMRIGYYGFFSDGGYNGGACSRRWFLSYSAYSLSTYRFSLFFLEVICFPFFFSFSCSPSLQLPSWNYTHLWKNNSHFLFSLLVFVVFNYIFFFFLFFLFILYYSLSQTTFTSHNSNSFLFTILDLTFSL